MRLPPIALVIAAGAVVAACGQATSHPPHHGLPSMASVSLAAPRSPQITGGTAAQRTLLRRIVRAMRPTQITHLTIEAASPQWHPIRAGDVALMAMVAPVAPHHENTLGEWESMVVGGAFRDRSAALGLPRVVVVGNPRESGRVTGGPHPPAQPAAGMAGYRTRVTAAAAASGARLIAVRVGVPDGYSAVVALQVTDPAAFLQHRLGPLNGRLERLTSDGTFIALYLPDGRPLYSEGGSTRLDGGLGGPAAPRYASCIPNQMEGLSMAPPLPCPSDSRPPPSTPLKPPKIMGYASGGTALDGDWNGKAGITVPYTPGATGALGFVLENPNGHPITIDSVAPIVAPGLPIRATGVRIQVPPSRARPGSAAELQKPYGPEPPMRPLTIRPGDWIFVSLHFQVVRACTAALAGRTVTVDRTFLVTYVLDGRTIRRALPGVPLNVTCPRAATGSG